MFKTLKPPLGARLNLSHPQAAGLVGCWLFNEGGGNKAFDLSNNGLHGTLEGSASWQLGSAGSHILCPNTGDGYIDVPNEGKLASWLSGSATIIARFYKPASGISKGFLGKNPDNVTWLDAVFDGANINVSIDDNVNKRTISGIAIVDDGLWHDWTLVKNGSSGYEAFVDGISDGTSIGNGDCSNTSSLKFGVALGYSELDGGFAFVYTWDRALTQSEITEIYTNPYAMFEPEPIWLMVHGAAGGEEHEKALSDTINLSDAIIKNFGAPKADTVTLSDGIAKNVGLPEADTISLSDGITKAPGLSKSDTISLSDNASLVVAFLRTLNDSISLSDEIAKNFGTTKADTITISDNLVSVIRAILMSLNDTITMSDEIAKNVGTTKTDTINISDNFNRVIAYLRTLGDTITMSDSESLGIGLNKSDAVTLSDSIVKQTNLSKSDIMTLSDSIAKEMGLSKADTITLSDFFRSDAGGALLFIIEQLGLNPMGGIH